MRTLASNRSGFDSFVKGFIALVAICIVLGGVFVAVPSATTVEQHTITVEDKDRSTDADGNSVYRVYTDQGVFSVQDSLVDGQFNAADTYNNLKVGNTYTVKTRGIRNGFFSMFPNIVEVIR